MSEKSGDWPWPDRWDGVVEAELTRDVRAEMRRFGVCWDSAEWGAPALADTELEPLYDEEDDSAEALCREMFLNTAKVKDWAGRVSNPFRRASRETKEMCLADVPCGKVRALLESGEDFDFAPDDDLLKLWEAADLRAGGIDPKRPFGSGMVSRDIRQLIDPEKTLSAAKFKARRLELEGQMMLMLLRFVQAAEMPYGRRARSADWEWLPVDEVRGRAGERIDYDEWVSRVWLPFVYGTEDYTKTLKAAAHLMWDGRLEGSYDALTEKMRLGDAYEQTEHGYSDVAPEEVLTLGLKEFGDVARPEGLKPMTRMMVRIFNATSRFDEALALLRRSKAYVELEPPTGLHQTGITPRIVFAMEGKLAELGLAMRKRSLWADDLVNDPAIGPIPWGDLHGVLHGFQEFESEGDHLTEQLRAIAAQLSFMRGPYVDRG